GLPPLREVIARHDIAARKRLGQNFILDLNLTRRIARAAGPLADATIIEIGPGPGGLTRALLAEGARRVVAIERAPPCPAAAAEPGLWAAVGHRAVAVRAANPVRHPAARLCAAAEGDFERRAVDAAGCAAGASLEASARTGHRRRLRAAPQDAALKPQIARR